MHISSMAATTTTIITIESLYSNLHKSAIFKYLIGALQMKTDKKTANKKLPYF